MMTKAHFRSQWRIISLKSAAFVWLLTLMSFKSATAQTRAEFQQTFTVSSTDPIILDIDVSHADVKILYSREGQVSITAQAQGIGEAKLDGNFFKDVLRIEQDGNRFTLKQVSSPEYAEEKINVLYHIDVPYRTQVTSHAENGSQTFSGITGPVKASSIRGDIKASYISKAFQAEIGRGNLDVEVIGEQVAAKVHDGNISCSRLPQGATAETDNGDISLMMVGPSVATVKNGSGRIEVGGSRASLAASTAAGSIHVKAVPHEDWTLRSESGDIRLEFPPQAAFELRAAGEIQLKRDDVSNITNESRNLQQKINGGGKLVTAQSSSGRIIIQ
jgi:DUF4097 and DUF4098 domain-containing protein YvlB